MDNRILYGRQQPCPAELLEKRSREVLCDKKWHKLNRRTWLFRHIPFVTFVFGSGSLAIGNVDPESDFDMLIGVRSGRIFTTRFFCALAFGLFGWRRSKEHGNIEAADKVCLNHFVTPKAYGLRLTANSYWRLLYQSIVPIYGASSEMQKFFDANHDWMKVPRVVESDLRYQHQAPSFFKCAVEWTLEGRAGAWLETKLRSYQVDRIERGLAVTRRPAAHEMVISGSFVQTRIELAPLIVYNDHELEFHPDPAVIEMTT